MVSKKAVKRKTVWRTLSIGAEAAAAAAPAGDATDQGAIIAGAADAATVTAGELHSIAAANVVTSSSTANLFANPAGAVAATGNTTNSPNSHHHHQQQQQRSASHHNIHNFDGMYKQLCIGFDK